jgi:hypothetical protein
MVGLMVLVVVTAVLEHGALAVVLATETVLVMLLGYMELPVKVMMAVLLIVQAGVVEVLEVLDQQVLEVQEQHHLLLVLQ